jgi:hypothetical protein
VCRELSEPWVSFGGGKDADCSKGLRHKCNTQQFFLLFGWFVHAASVVAPLSKFVVNMVPAFPNFVGIATALTTACSYFIVWVVWAYMKSEKMKIDKSTCGLNEFAGFTSDVGGAFVCILIAFFATLGQIALYVKPLKTWYEG